MNQQRKTLKKHSKKKLVQKEQTNPLNTSFKKITVSKEVPGGSQDLQILEEQDSSESSEIQKKMDPRIKTLWVEAARSGKFLQVRGVLRGHTQGECCILGILDYLYEEDTGQSSSRYMHDVLLTEEVAEWAGLDDQIGKHYSVILRYKGRKEFIHGLNDAHELSFKELADLIEEQL